MAGITQYQQLLEAFLAERARSAKNSPNKSLETMIVCDHERGQYLLINSGWLHGRREYGVAYHAHIQNGKIVVEWDGTSPSITNDLIDAGVAKSDIILAFYEATPTLSH